MDITVGSTTSVGSLYNISSDAILSSISSGTESEETTNIFESMLGSAIDNISTTNGYLSDQENEELKFAMGISENTHDLSIATQKAETALAYTVALRDKFLEAYQEIMNIQI